MKIGILMLAALSVAGKETTFESSMLYKKRDAIVMLKRQAFLIEMDILNVNSMAQETSAYDISMLKSLNESMHKDMNIIQETIHKLSN